MIYLKFDPDKRYSALEWLGWVEYTRRESTLRAEWYGLIASLYISETINKREFNIMWSWAIQNSNYNCSDMDISAINSFRGYCYAMAELEQEYGTYYEYLDDYISTIHVMLFHNDITFDEYEKLVTPLIHELESWYSSCQQEILDKYFADGGR